MASAITDAVDIPLLNLVEMAADQAASLLGPGGKVGLLASPAVFHTHLYNNALEKRGLTAVWPASFDVMLRAIRTIKAGGDLNAARQDLKQVSQELIVSGSEIQIVACSEFSIIADCVPSDARAFDSLDVLAKATADYSLSRQVSLEPDLRRAFEP